MGNSKIHPDKLVQTNGPIERFVFSTKVMEPARRETLSLIGTFETKIDELNRESAIQGMTLIDKILTITRDRAALKNLANALSKTADLIPVLDDLLIRKQVFDLAEKDPTFFAYGFADLENESDTLMENLTLHLESGDPSIERE